MKNIILGSVMCLAFAASSYAQTTEQTPVSVSNDTKAGVTLPASSQPATTDTEANDLRGGGGGHGGGMPGGHGGGAPHPGPMPGGHGGGGAPHPGPMPGHGGGGAPHPGPGPGHGGPGPVHPGPGPGHGGPGPVHPGPGPGHGGPGPAHPGPGHGPIHPGPGHGGPIGHHPGPGWHDGGPRPGWHNGWHHDNNWRPHWYYPGIALPIFVWAPESPRGYWQCTAFSQNSEVFSASAPVQEEAVYDALYDCGGPDYESYGCYIPAGYCQYRP